MLGLELMAVLRDIFDPPSLANVVKFHNNDIWSNGLTCLKKKNNFLTKAETNELKVHTPKLEKKWYISTPNFWKCTSGAASASAEMGHFWHL